MIPTGSAKSRYGAGSGTLTVLNDGVAVASDDIPVGAVVTLTEQAPEAVAGATWGEGTFSPATVTIGSGDPVAVTLTNPISLDYGTFTVVKAIDGPAGLVSSDASFTVDYSYPAGPGYGKGSGTLTVLNDGVAVASDDIPVGAVVTLTEDAPEAVAGATWGEASFSPATVTIGSGDPVAVTLTNPISLDPVDPSPSGSVPSSPGLPVSGTNAMIVAAVAALGVVMGGVMLAIRRRVSRDN